jgi:hypothetical protein
MSERKGISAQQRIAQSSASHAGAGVACEADRQRPLLTSTAGPPVHLAPPHVR